jgi:ubiquinone/menaquinone biosynthesis C-methylase UbiE
MHTDMHQQNREVYLDQQVIKEYVNQDYLFAPERKFIEIAKDKLAGFSMLDIGVGAGRTTLNFAPLVKRYVGIDYSEEMLSICSKRFAGVSNIALQLGDMRSLEMFEDDSFDFILISYNAISALTHEDRLKTFAEVRRVGKPGAYFYFSAHNLQWVPRVLLNFRRQISWVHPKITYWNLLKWLKAYKHNDANVIRQLQELPYAIINDGAHDFRLLHYYIKPRAQVQQLSAYFTNIRVFGHDGHELRGDAELDANIDGYLHYLCTVPEK